MAKKLDAFLYVCLYVAIYWFSQMIVSSLLPLINTVGLFLSGEKNFTYLSEYFIDLIQSGSQNGFFEAVGAMILTLLLVWLVFTIRKRRFFSAFKIKKLYFKDIAAAILISFGLQAVSILVMKIPFPESFFEIYDEHMTYASYGNMASVFIISGIAAPIFEELFFRGAIYDEFSKSGGFFYTNFLQSLIFALLHFNIIQGIYAFGAAFALGAVLKLSKSIYICILIHILFNVSNLLFGAYIEAMSAMPYFILCGLIALILGYLLMKRK